MMDRKNFSTDRSWFRFFHAFPMYFLSSYLKIVLPEMFSNYHEGRKETDREVCIRISFTECCLQINNPRAEYCTASHQLRLFSRAWLPCSAWNRWMYLYLHVCQLPFFSDMLGDYTFGIYLPIYVLIYCEVLLVSTQETIIIGTNVLTKIFKLHYTLP